MGSLSYTYPLGEQSADVATVGRRVLVPLPGCQSLIYHIGICSERQQSSTNTYPTTGNKSYYRLPCFIVVNMPRNHTLYMTCMKYQCTCIGVIFNMRQDLSYKIFASFCEFLVLLIKRVIVILQQNGPFGAHYVPIGSAVVTYLHTSTNRLAPSFSAVKTCSPGPCPRIRCLGLLHPNDILVECQNGWASGAGPCRWA